MRDGHDSYAKSWVSKYDDGWYLSLNLHQRGMWDQLYTWAKRSGDTGEISFRSWSHMGSVMGCDGKTCRKILEKFHADSKVVLRVDQQPGNFLTIFIVKYIHNQQDSAKARRESRGNLQKSPENSPPTEERENRREQRGREEDYPQGNFPARSKQEDHSLWCLEFFGTTHGDWLGLLTQGTGWRDWCNRIVTQFGRERIEAATPFIVKYLKEKRKDQGRTYAVDMLRKIVWDRVETFSPIGAGSVESQAEIARKRLEAEGEL